MLAVGGRAPDFALRDQHAQLHTLAEHRGSRAVVLVFFPFAFTGVCTAEMQAIRDEIAGLDHAESRLFAVSCDPVASLRAFADTHMLNHPLLSDFWPHGAVASAYGVFDQVIGAAERATFVIDRDGVVRWTVRTDMGVARDVADYQKALAGL